MKGSIAIFVTGNGFLAFLFDLREDRYAIFCNGPYFLLSWGMYRNKWSPEFNTDDDVPTTIPVLVKFPRL